MNGQGLYTWLDGKKYKGNYVNGVKNGYGEMKWPNGRLYKGDWKEGVQEGKGQLFDSNGELLFEGQWKHGQPIETETTVFN